MGFASFSFNFFFGIFFPGIEGKSPKSRLPPYPLLTRKLRGWVAALGRWAIKFSFRGGEFRENEGAKRRQRVLLLVSAKHATFSLK